MLRAPLLWPLVLLAAACGSGTSASQDGASANPDAGTVGNQPPGIRLGQGSSAFVPLADGQGLELIFGPQGGWHMEVTCRFWGVEPDGATLSYAALQPGDGGVAVSLPNSIVLNRQRVVPEGNAWVRLGDRVVLDVASPAAVVGQVLTLRVSATQGATAVADERSVTVVDNVP